VRGEFQPVVGLAGGSLDPKYLSIRLGHERHADQRPLRQLVIGGRGVGHEPVQLTLVARLEGASLALAQRTPRRIDVLDERRVLALDGQAEHLDEEALRRVQVGHILDDEPEPWADSHLRTLLA
jgi:hypothetical protein